MFTTGSKYFLGITALAGVTALIYAFVVNPQDLGSVALLGLMAGSGLIGGLALFTRDADVTTDAAATAANAPAAGPGIWPIFTALGVAVLLVGLASHPSVFMLGIAVTSVGAIEWLFQDWADSASADSAFNRFVRARSMNPIEIPVFAALGVAVMAYSFSRIMLAIDKVGGAFVFIVVAAAILTVGFLIAFKPSFRGKIATSIIAVGAVALISAGAVSGVAGERAELADASANKHYSEKECGEEASKHFDHHSSNAVSARSSVLATVILEDGKLGAIVVGLPEKVSKITVARSNDVNILFRNKDSEDRRLVANLGEVKPAGSDLAEKVVDCTQLTGKNQEQILTFKINKPSQVGGPYTLSVPGVEGTKIELLVP